MANKYVISVLIILSSIAGYSQDFDSFKRQQQEKFEKFKKEREDQLKNFDESFRMYVQKKNEEFEKYLGKEWIAFNTFKGEERPEMPKPDIIPVCQEPFGNLKPQRISPILTKQIGNGIRPIPELIRLPKSEYSPNSNQKNISFLLYGQKIELWIDPDLICNQQAEINQNAIKQVWKDITGADYAGLIAQLYEYKDKHNFNDWGYFKLCDATANALSKYNSSYKRAISWTLMNLSGYKVNIGVSGESCYIMIPTLQKLFSTYSMNINGERFYILDFNGGEIYSYKQEFEESGKYLDLNISKPLNLEGNIISSNLSGESFQNWEIEVSKNIIDFYNDYPLVDFPVYFNTPMSSVTRNSLMAKLNPQLEGKTDIEKVEYLLHFVQNAFQYMTDQEQFGHEKFCFPDEILYYPFSDCEDRSILFSYLVRWLVNYDVIGVNYPLHIATAVAFPSKMPGDYLEFNGKNYTVCDPTYINASIGMSMPEFIGISPSIIPVSNFFSGTEDADKIWVDLIASGASKTCTQNYCFDDLGKCFVTGIFGGSLTIEGKSINSKNGETDVFVACFDHNGVLSWINKIDNGIHDFINGITFGNNKLYLCGNSSSIDGKENQAFVSSFTNKGEPLWKSNINIEHSLIGESINGTYHLAFDGKIISEELLSSGSEVVIPGIYTSNNELVVHLNYSNSLGLRIDDIITTETSEMTINDRLKTEYDKIIHTNCEPYTAAVLAVLNLMNFNGMVLKGEEICNILENSNPEIATSISELVKNLKRVEYFKNENGLITLKTKDGKGLVLYRMYLSDKSSIKIAKVAGQKTQIECLSGIMVGNAVLKFPLNFINVDLVKGDFLFDYGKDHSKENINLKEDILEI